MKKANWYSILCFVISYAFTSCEMLMLSGTMESILKKLRMCSICLDWHRSIFIYMPRAISLQRVRANSTKPHKKKVNALQIKLIILMKFNKRLTADIHKTIR